MFVPVDIDEGRVADFIAALARVPRDLFGLSIVGVNGAVYESGLPGKSEVSSGIVTIASRKGGLTKYLSERMGLNFFASRPEG